MLSTEDKEMIGGFDFTSWTSNFWNYHIIKKNVSTNSRFSEFTDKRNIFACFASSYMYVSSSFWSVHMYYCHFMILNNCQGEKQKLNLRFKKQNKIKNE